MSVQVIPLSAEAVAVLGEALKLLAVIGAVNGLNDPRGVAVERLTGSAAESSSSGNGPVGAVKDGGGVGDAQRRR